MKQSYELEDKYSLMIQLLALSLSLLFICTLLMQAEKVD
jgi:hypothetical protein